MVAGWIFAEEGVRNDRVGIYFEGKRAGFGNKLEIGTRLREKSRFSDCAAAKMEINSDF